MRAPEAPQPASHGAGIAQDEADYERLLPFLFGDAAIEGVLPLERQAGVDVNRIRRNDPDWILIGGYDKTIMHLGEEAMRREFDRLLPAMQSGRYIPSVDHQTPRTSPSASTGHTSPCFASTRRGAGGTALCAAPRNKGPRGAAP